MGVMIFGAGYGNVEYENRRGWPVFSTATMPKSLLQDGVEVVFKSRTKAHLKGPALRDT